MATAAAASTDLPMVDLRPDTAIKEAVEEVLAAHRTAVDLVVGTEGISSAKGRVGQTRGTSNDHGISCYFFLTLLPGSAQAAEARTRSSHAAFLPFHLWACKFSALLYSFLLCSVVFYVVSMHCSAPLYPAVARPPRLSRWSLNSIALFTTDRYQPPIVQIALTGVSAISGACSLFGTGLA